MSDDLIALTEIAQLHSRHKSVIHKIVRRLGMETLRVRSEQTRGQEALYITKSDYELFIPKCFEQAMFQWLLPGRKNFSR